MLKLAVLGGALCSVVGLACPSGARACWVLDGASFGPGGGTHTYR